MFIHKAVIGSETYYRLCDSTIDKTITIQQGDWTEVVSANSGNLKGAIGRIEKALKSPIVEEKETKEEKVATIIEHLDKVAADIQAEGSLEIAKALDWVSDIIENKIQ